MNVKDIVIDEQTKKDIRRSIYELISIPSVKLQDNNVIISDDTIKCENQTI